MKSQELTAADHVVVFETEWQARGVLETVNAYSRAAILVRNLKGETHIVGVFKSKKDAIEAKGSIAGVSNSFCILTRNDSGYNHLRFIDIVDLAVKLVSFPSQLVTCDKITQPPCFQEAGKYYAKIDSPETTEFPVAEEKQEVVEVVDKPIIPTHGDENIPRKATLAAFPSLMNIESARDTVRFAKLGKPVYAPVKSIDESERDDGISHYVLFATVNRIIAKTIARDDKSDLTEACKLAEIKPDETFVFEELDCEAVTYAATVDAQSIMHPNGRWKIYFHDDDERPDDVKVEFDGWDLNGDEYRIEFGFNGHDERIVFRIYAKDIMWDGKIRDLVCICRHPDALPEDDMGYKRPPVNPHSVPLITIPWLETENENEEYEYAY